MSKNNKEITFPDVEISMSPNEEISFSSLSIEEENFCSLCFNFVNKDNPIQYDFHTGYGICLKCRSKTHCSSCGDRLHNYFCLNDCEYHSD